MPQRLNDLEDDRISKRPVRGVQFPLDHNALSEFPRGQLPVDLKMAHANVGDLALFEETVADHVASALAFRVGKQPNRRIDVREIMLGLRDLHLIRRNAPIYFGALVLQRLDDHRFRHVEHNSVMTAYEQTKTWCI